MTVIEQPRAEDVRALKAASALRESGGRHQAQRLTEMVGTENVEALHAATVRAEAWLELKAAASARED